MSEKKTKVIFVKTACDLHATVKNVADGLDVTVSQFARDAIREKIARESKKRPNLATTRRAAATV